MRIKYREMCPMTLKEEMKKLKVFFFFCFWSKEQIEKPERRKTRPKIGGRKSHACKINGSEKRFDTWRDLNGCKEDAEGKSQKVKRFMI